MMQPETDTMSHSAGQTSTLSHTRHSQEGCVRRLHHGLVLEQTRPVDGDVTVTSGDVLVGGSREQLELGE